ncbi:hypothetical protein TWF718_006695 [Orbilia javanica]|uniref:Uncharacterized protein n=1 Tax=Orbilia javanica TaxID=47235 RepID=A0AAN8RHW8_9PEZI
MELLPRRSRYVSILQPAGKLAMVFDKILEKGYRWEQQVKVKSLSVGRMSKVSSVSLGEKRVVIKLNKEPFGNIQVGCFAEEWRLSRLVSLCPVLIVWWNAAVMRGTDYRNPLHEAGARSRVNKQNSNGVTRLRESQNSRAELSDEACCRKGGLLRSNRDFSG